jgi:PIN domain nuclease of toxin-antitoxin system
VILLDTHSLLWWVNRDRELSAGASAAIEAEMPGGEILVSSMSVWEIALLVTRGRLGLGMELGAWLASVETVPGVKFLPVDNKIAVLAITLPDEFHKDPADRIIVATARKFGAPIVTADEKIRSYRHVRTIW